MGRKVPMGNNKTRPEKLPTFRLTSQDRNMLECAAAIYGGKVNKWADQEGQCELIIQQDELPFVISPVPISQFYELWSGGGCSRRCDGQMNAIDDKPCVCPLDPAERQALAAKGQACKPTTRFSVMLPDLPGLGVFRLETHGYYAAMELGPTAEMLLSQAKQGNYIIAYLAIETRRKVSNGQTKTFPVPVIRIRQTLGEILPGRIPSPALEGGSAPAIAASVPASRQIAAPAPSVKPVSNLTPEQYKKQQSNLLVKTPGWFPDPVKDKPGTAAMLSDLLMCKVTVEGIKQLTGEDMKIAREELERRNAEKAYREEHPEEVREDDTLPTLDLDEDKGDPFADEELQMAGDELLNAQLE